MGLTIVTDGSMDFTDIASDTTDLYTVNSIDTISIDDALSDLNTYTSNNSFSSAVDASSKLGYGNLTTAAPGSTLGNLWYSSGTASPLSTTSPYTFIQPSSSGKLEITGSDADLTINGKSLKAFMEGVEDRLMILQPDPKKLEKYEALRKAYDHYKLLEKLVGED